MDERTTRQNAREAIQGGKLPSRRPERMWGGPGTDANCTVCGKSLKHEETRLEIEFARDEGTGVVNHFVHVQCFAAWELECQVVEQAQALSGARNGSAADLPMNGAASAHSGAPATGDALQAASNDGTIASRERDNMHKQETA